MQRRLGHEYVRPQTQAVEFASERASASSGVSLTIRLCYAPDSAVRLRSRATRATIAFPESDRPDGREPAMPLPRKGTPAPTDADDRFDDSRHPHRTLASNGSRSSGPASRRSGTGGVSGARFSRIAQLGSTRLRRRTDTPHAYVEPDDRRTSARFRVSSQARAATSIVSRDDCPADATVSVALGRGAAAFVGTGKLREKFWVSSDPAVRLNSQTPPVQPIATPGGPAAACGHTIPRAGGRSDGLPASRSAGHSRGYSWSGLVSHSWRGFRLLIRGALRGAVSRARADVRLAAVC